MHPCTLIFLMWRYSSDFSVYSSMMDPYQLHNISNWNFLDASFIGVACFLWCPCMLTSLLVLMLLCCDFWNLCYYHPDCFHIGLYSVFDFLLYLIHLGKCNLDFLVLRAPLEIVQVSSAPSEMVLVFLPCLWILVFFSLTELLGGCVENYIQFV